MISRKIEGDDERQRSGAVVRVTLLSYAEMRKYAVYYVVGRNIASNGVECVVGGERKCMTDALASVSGTMPQQSRKRRFRRAVR